MRLRFRFVAERRKNGGKFVEPLDADLGRPERHAGAVALVEHPVRQLAAKIRPLVRVDARQFLAAPERRDLQRPPEQRMPTDRQSSQTENCMQNVACWADRVKIVAWDGSGLVLFWNYVHSYYTSFSFS